MRMRERETAIEIERMRERERYGVMTVYVKSQISYVLKIMSYSQ